VHALAFAASKQFPSFREACVLQPDAVLRKGQLWRLATGLFVSIEPSWEIYILVAVFLWIFGRDLECRLGRGDFLCVYLGGGAFAGLLWAAAALVWDWHQPMRFVGAVSVLVMLRMLYGVRTPLRLFGSATVPAWILGVAYVGGVAWLLRTGLVEVSAQLCGGLFSLLYDQFNWSLAAFRQRWARLAASLRTRLLGNPVQNGDRFDDVRVPPDKQKDEGEAEDSVDLLLAKLDDPECLTAEDAFNKRVDELLVKIKEGGFASLTEDEIQLLMEASRRHRKRREK
jgi:membrane associated rhomboid family serine protease